MERFVFEREKLPQPILSGKQEWIDLYYSAWALAFKNVAYPTKAGWKPQLTCYPEWDCLWQWDSCIMTLITNYANGTLNAFNNLDNLYRLQRKSDGFMAMAYNIADDKEAYPGRINPPLMAWAEWEHYLISGDASRFQMAVDVLDPFYHYIEQNRRRNCGLYWFEDSGSAGMDNSPRAGYAAQGLLGSDVCFIDLACQQALSALCLGKMYRTLGNSAKATYFEGEQERICALINERHWSEKGTYYFDFFSRAEAEKKVKFLNTYTAAAFWTLLCGAAQGERRQGVIDHLFNPDEFYTEIPFASLSKKDLNYDATGGYWLGGVWPPTNIAAVKGLSAGGEFALARKAAEKFLDGMCRIANNPAYGSIWECYAPESFQPATTEDGKRCKKDFVGWGGIGPITMLIENVIGLQFFADKNTVTFHLPSSETAGLKNMQFNGQQISVVCHRKASKITVKTSAEQPFDLVVYLPNSIKKTLSIEAGQREYLL